MTLRNLFVGAAVAGGGGITRIDVQGNAGGTDGTGHITQTVDSTGADFVLVFLSANAGGDFNPSCTFDGVDMGTEEEDNTTGQYQAMWKLVAPNQGTGKVADVLLPNTGFAATIIVISYSGVHQTTPIGTVDKVGATTGTSLSSGTVTCAAGNWIVSHVAPNGNEGPNITCTGGGNTEVFTVGSISSIGASYGEDTDGADDTFDWAWTNSVSRVSIQTFELKKA